MKHQPSYRGAARRPIRTVVSVALSLFLLSIGTGCISYQRQGDNAFERGDCNEALAAYERAMEEKPTEPDLYYRAAKCSLRMGDFASAERYYSQSLRYGGGIEVARDLADFYVKTSNYVSAIRVYQYLLYREADKQPVYNNLGTALMYAGQHFDAESYLMVAQQLDPADPTPYVNLGVLYDRHLRQPWLAVNFYDCFLKLGTRAENAEMVAQRSKELRKRYSKMYDPSVLECGEPYEPRDSVPVKNLQEAIDLDMGGEEAADGKQKDGQAGSTDGSAKQGDGSVDGAEEAPKEVPIDRMITDEEGDMTPSSEEELRRGREAYGGGRWAEAVDALTKVPMSKLAAAEQQMLGFAYLNQANWTLAIHWLELARSTDPQPETVGGLLKAYTGSQQEGRVKELCQKYRNSGNYEKILAEHCTVEGVDE